MDSAKCGAHAGVLFDEVNAALQIIAAEKDVVEHWWHLIDERRYCGLLLCALCEDKNWRDCGGRSELDKSSASNDHEGYLAYFGRSKEKRLTQRKREEAQRTRRWRA